MYHMRQVVFLLGRGSVLDINRLKRHGRNAISNLPAVMTLRCRVHGICITSNQGDLSENQR
jgi:hypothetical protein